MTDNCNNMDTYTHTIMVKDTTRPVITCPPLVNINTVTNCQATVNLMATVNDNCANGYLTTSFSVDNNYVNVLNLPSGPGLNASATYSAGEYTVTFAAKDPCGNLSFCQTILNVEDQDAPQASCKDKLVTVTTSGWAVITPEDINDGSFDLCGPVMLSLDEYHFPCPLPATCTGSPGTPEDHIVILTVTDASGNQSTCTVTVSVYDGSAPSAFCKPYTAILSSTSPGMATVLASDITDTGTGDACGIYSIRIAKKIPNMTPVFGAQITYGCSEIGKQPVILEVKDCWGNIKTCIDTVTVVDDTPPVLGCLATPYTVQLAQDGMYTLTQNVKNALLGTSADNCSFTAVFSPDMFTCADINADGDPMTGVNGNEGVEVKIVLTDPSGNKDSCYVTVIVEDMIAPMITCAQNVEIALDANGVDTLLGQEIVNGGIYISSGNSGTGTAGTTQHCRTIPKPMWLEFDYEYSYNLSGTGTIPPSCDTFGYSINDVFTPIYYVCTGMVPGSGSGTISISGANAPLLSANDNFCFVTKTTDNKNGRLEVWIKNLNGTTPGTPTGKVKPIDLNDPADWDDPTNTANTDGKCFFYDACGPVDLTVSPNLFNCGNLMATSPIPVTVTAEDANGNTSTCMGSVVVVDKEPPAIVCTDELIINLNGLGQASVPAINFVTFIDDACCNTFLDSVAIIDPLTGDWGTFHPTLNVDCDDIDTFMVVVKITDCYGNSAYCMPMVTVKDKLPPVFVMCPADITVECDDFASNLMLPPPSLTGIAMAVDNCGPIALPYPDSSNFMGTQVLSANRDCQKFRRTWKATDTKGNTSLCTQIITVEDNTAPTFGDPDFFLPVTVECQPPAVTDPTANDLCAGPVTPTLDTTDSRINYTTTPPSFIYTPNQCGYYNYDITRKWTATDNCGNSVQASKLIQVRDTQKPVFTCQTKIVANNTPGLCTGYADINLSGCIADCAVGYLTLSYTVYLNTNPLVISQIPTTSAPLANSGANASGNYPVGVHSIVFLAVDPCGNWDYFVLTLKVKDTETPTPACYMLFKTLSNNGTLIIDPSDIDLGNSDDNCGIVSLTLSQSVFDCGDIGQNPITLTAVDAAGNVGVCTTSVVIQLPAQPGILCQNNLTVNCDQSLIPSAAGPTMPAQVIISGACSGLITPSHKDVQIMGTQPNCRTIERTWTAAGASCVQIITVVDPQAPVFVAASLPATADCSAVPTAPNRTANDNCLGVLTIPPVVTSMQGSNPALCSYYSYPIEWKWTATDNCNAPVTVTHTVSITDNNGPVLTIANPFVYPTTLNTCQANVILNLLDYLSDCAADYLTVTNTITNNATMQPVANGNGTTNINGVYQPGFYDVKVTATDPCGNTTMNTFTLHVKDTQAPEAHCFNSSVTLDNTGNADLTVTQVDNGSHDNCGAVTLSFAAPPASPVSTLYFNTGDIGTQVVTLYVTDGTGNTSSCNAVITVTDDPTFIAGNAIGAPGEMKLLPVSVMQYQDIVSFQMKFSINTAVATLVDVIPVHPSLTGGFVYTAPVPPNMVTVGWVQPSPATGIDINDGEILFNLKVMISNAAVPGNSTIVDIDQPTLEVGQLISGVPTTVQGVSVDGSVYVVNMATSHIVSGDLRTMPDPNPGFPNPGPDPCAPNYSVLIPGVNVGYSGTLNGNIPAAPGMFSLVVPDGANQTFTPSKSNPAFFGNPVTAYDAFRVQNYAVNNDPPDGNPALAPLQIVAADADHNNVVTQFDATLVQELSAKPTSLPRYWRFIPETVALTLPAYPFVPGFNEFRTYNNITADITDADFIGVRVGNVFGCEDPSLFTSYNTDDRGEKVLFRIDDTPVVAGEEVTVTFKAKDFQNLVTCQYTLNFNPHVLEFVEAVPNVLGSNSTGLIFNSIRADEGLLAVSWFNQTPVNLPDGESLYTFKFIAMQNAGSLKELLSVSDDYIVVEAAKHDGTFLGVGLVFEGVTTAAGEQLAGKFALYQNSPNPFGYRTAIGFSLPESTNVKLTISDTEGRVVKEIKGYYGAGYHQVFVERKELSANGVLFYRLDTPTHTAVKKMVIVD